ncbi:hypothetical protein EVAR_37903_1 [Eumeta japonica]|uniref:Uncharacterized protein n=1 Tax=Eumeta variegata TaxID=151549 RepID=A0A4C1XDV6_EUMVA|nr:hypothetical protein EVAR_37903_1 [Eumeta japonica]
MWVIVCTLACVEFPYIANNVEHILLCDLRFPKPESASHIPDYLDRGDDTAGGVTRRGLDAPARVNRPAGGAPADRISAFRPPAPLSAALIPVCIESVDLHRHAAVLWSTWLQHGNGSTRSMKYHTFTKYGREVTASAVTFRPTGFHLESGLECIPGGLRKRAALSLSGRAFATEPSANSKIRRTLLAKAFSKIKLKLLSNYKFSVDVAGFVANQPVGACARAASSMKHYRPDVLFKVHELPRRRFY